MSQPRRLLLQVHVGFVELKVPIFELFHLYRLLVVLLHFVHQLGLKVGSELSLFLKGLLEEFVIPPELGLRL